MEPIPPRKDHKHTPLAGNPDLRDYPTYDPARVIPRTKKERSMLTEIFRVMGLITKIGLKIPGIVADGKVTAAELWELATDVADEYGFDVDTDGFNVPGK